MLKRLAPVAKRRRGRPKKNTEIEEEETNTILPGLEPEPEPEPQLQPEEEESSILPGFDDVEEEPTQPQMQSNVQPQYNVYNMPEENDAVDDSYLNNADLSSLITPGKKIVCFLGTSKNGTSFIDK